MWCYPNLRFQGWILAKKKKSLQVKTKELDPKLKCRVNMALWSINLRKKKKWKKRLSPNVKSLWMSLIPRINTCIYRSRCNNFSNKMLATWTFKTWIFLTMPLRIIFKIVLYIIRIQTRSRKKRSLIIANFLIKNFKDQKII